MTMSEDHLGSTDALYSAPHSSDNDEQDTLIEEQRKPQHYEPKPVDHYNVTYIIFFVLGVGSSLPWNFICTAKHYWTYKLRNCSDTPVIENLHASDLSDYFESYFSIATAVPSVPCLILNYYLVNRISSQVRIVSSLLVVLLVFILVTVLVKVDTSTWTQNFFILTLICVVLLSGASNILTASIFGVTGRFPLIQSQALISGQGMGGTISALAAILDLTIASEVTDSALAYFITADVFLLLCLGAYLMLPRIKYCRHYLNVRDESINHSHPGVSAETVVLSSPKTDSPPIIPILKKVKMLAGCLFYTFFISIIIFPAISAGIESVEKHTGSVWTNKYFTPMTCFLAYNFADWSGRQITTWIQIPGPRSKMMPFLVFLRTIFIPLFMFCNYQPRKHIFTVFFQSDVYPIIFIALLGLSNGYLGTLAMVYGPKVVPKEQSEGTAIVMSFFLGLGLAVGSAFSSLVHLI